MATEQASASDDSLWFQVTAEQFAEFVQILDRDRETPRLVSLLNSAWPETV